MLLQALCIILYPLVNSNLSYSPETLNLGQNRRFLSRVTQKFYGWPWKKIGHLFYLCYFKLCAAFRSHWWIQTGVTVLKRPIWVKFDDFCSLETANLGQIWRFLEPCDLEIWRMTFQNNRAPLLCYFKLCASFRTHWWIKTWVTVRKRSIRVKIDAFLSRVTWKTIGTSKTIGHLFYATSSFVHHFIPIGEFKLENNRDLKNNRASFLCYFKLCASFHTHWWIQIGVTVQKTPILVKFDDF